jgi:carbon starvation protein
VFQTLNMPVVNLPDLERQVGETVAGRTGGGVSLAVGMAQIFTALPGMRGLMAYWYHFAIMFEALFILTTIDAGTRVGRFLVQEFLGRAYKPFARPDWLPGSVIATTLVVAGWSFFIYTGEINTIWPMFGIANQLLACVALTVGTTIIISMGKVRYSWVTIAPLTFLAVNTLYAGYLSIRDNFWPMAQQLDPKTSFTGWVQTLCTIIMMACVFIIIGAAMRKWFTVLSSREPQVLQASES